MRRLLQLVVAVSCLAVARGESLPAGFATTLVVDGLDRPTTLAFAPDGRVFIAGKDGRILVLRPGERTPLLFADLRTQVNDYWDRGLLGIAVHPSWPATPWIYLSYVVDPPGVVPDGSGGRVQRISRISAKPEDLESMLPGSETILVGLASTRENIGDETSSDLGRDEGCRSGGGYVQDCIPADSPSHAGSTLAFSLDGSALLATTGDGAHFNGVDVHALRALDADSLAGKVLRLDPVTGDGLPDNPFWNGSPRSSRSRVYAMGLRNPFRMTVHPQSGEPFIGDVGWNSWEEINSGRGANFGWPCYEGSSTTSARQTGYQFGTGTSASCSTLYRQGLGAVKRPLFAYAHSGQGASVQAGAFLEDESWPEPYRGALFYTDYNRDFIKYLTFDQNGFGTSHDFAEDLAPSGGPVQLTVGPDGELWYTLFDGATSSIRRLRYTPGNAPPIARAEASPRNGEAPLDVAFSSTGSFDPEGDALAFSWDFGDGSARSSEAFPQHSYLTTGAYDASLTVRDALGASASATIRILVGNDPPVPLITQPMEGELFDARSLVALQGSASDAQDGVLPGTALTWDVRIRHEQHVHFDYFHEAGASASLTAPDHGDEEHALQICLSATDSGGASTTTCREILPHRVALNLATDPEGLLLVYAGTQLTGPTTVAAVVGGRRDLVAPETQAGYVFASWSDGGPRARTLGVTAAPQTLTASYEQACIAGDIAPETQGDGVVGLADFVLAQRKVLGLAPGSERDLACGDLHPGRVACEPSGAPQLWCIEGDDAFTQGDVVALRRMVLGVQVLGCTACATSVVPLTSWRPGDVAPRPSQQANVGSGGDGEVRLDDVIVALRVATGLDVPLESERLKLDVAPAHVDEHLRIVQGDARIDVADVTLLLRATVGLDILAWPLRSRELVAQADAPMTGLLVRVMAWPEWAETPSIECLGTSGFDAESVSGGWAAASVVSPPSERVLMRITWRSPWPFAPDASAESIDSLLRSQPVHLR